MDYLTKWPEAKAIPDASANVAAQFIYEDIICRHGCPKELLSDRGTTFFNETIRQLCLNHGIKHRLLSPYHTQTNGLVERFNRTLCQSLAKYVDLVQHDWDKYIPAVLFAYRTMKQDSIYFELFILTYGHIAVTLLDLTL